MLNIPFRCERTIFVKKHLSEVQPAIADFNTWVHWSPWIRLEPNCTVTLSGEPGELGHTQTWEGERVGSGRMELMHVSANSLRFDLAFAKPWKSRSTVEFNLNGHGGETKVTWLMKGGLPVFLFFMRKTMKALVESDFDRGLAMFRDTLERGIPITASTVTGEVDKPGFFYMGVRRATSIDDMHAEMSRDFGQIMEWVSAGELPKPQAVLTLYHVFDLVDRRTEFTSALAYAKKPENIKNLTVGKISSHRALKVVHRGAYDYLGNAWGTIMAEQRAKKIKVKKRLPCYEVYLNSPSDVELEELKTEIYLPVK